MTWGQVWLLCGGSSLIALAMLGVWVLLDRQTVKPGPDAGLDIMAPAEDRDDWGAASELEVDRWADTLQTMRIAPSPFVMLRALEQHDPMEWRHRSRLWGERHIREQRRRIRILSTETQPFDRGELMRVLRLTPPPPVLRRQVWDRDAAVWVPTPAEVS